MKCLSIQQPWATLIVAGATRFEVRSWRTPYRGLLAIHAGRKMPRDNLRLCRAPAVATWLERLGYHLLADLPTQAVLGTVQLKECWWSGPPDPPSADPADLRVMCGNLPPEQWLWQFQEPVAFPVPASWPGNLRIFDIPDDLAERAVREPVPDSVRRVKPLWRFQAKRHPGDQDED